MTAFETNCFDRSLAISFLSEHASPWEITSALYALEFHDFARQHPEDTDRLVVPLLGHESPFVRHSAMDLLRYDPSRRHLIESLRDDPSHIVREWVPQALEFMENFEPLSPIP
jgi:HEAT repeat protein